MKLLIIVLSVPFIVLSRFCEAMDFLDIRKDIRRCIEIVDFSKSNVPFAFISTLIVAEDHRSPLHRGVDPIAMIRATYVRLLNGCVQGASTIEQQFVRVATNRFERTVKRKIREQILAIAVSRRRSKHEIASAYLSIAFYGTGCMGVSGLRSHCGQNLASAQKSDILGMISRLKYPEPLYPSVLWHRKLQRRVDYIIAREKHSAINVSQLIITPLSSSAENCQKASYNHE